MKEDKNLEFYKSFYENNRVRILQYENLRKHFSSMVEDILGSEYYNMGMDVYDADRLCCEDVTFKANRKFLGIFKI